MGLRGTEERFLEYGLMQYLDKNKLVYDLGCNNGFLSIYCALRSGCAVRGVDINPFMINIANACAKSFNLPNVEFVAQDLRVAFNTWHKADIILSLAAMWTDDAQYRVHLEEHFQNCLKLLKNGGILVLETHSNAQLSEPIRSIVVQEGLRLLEEKVVDCQSKLLFIIQTQQQSRVMMQINR